MAKKNILLVDDDEITRDEFAQIFEGTEYKLHFAVNSIEGLNSIKRNHFDLILLDIIMPDLNNRQNKRAGFELLKEIKKIKPYIPVIMVSVRTHANIALEALDMGAVDYITKDTITSKDLRKKVEKALAPIKKSTYKPDLFSLIKKGESSKLEFKSSMRWNFTANSIDERVEIEWLKTIIAFMNTEGGILLIGVRDNKTINGIEYDKFPNEDKCLLHFTDMIKKYIGLEFSKFIKNELIPISGKKVLYVECEESKEPAFLKRGKEGEEFYIRVGPSTRKLPMSKMLNYLKNKKR